LDPSLRDGIAVVPHHGARPVRRTAFSQVRRHLPRWNAPREDIVVLASVLIREMNDHRPGLTGRRRRKISARKSNQSCDNNSKYTCEKFDVHVSSLLYFRIVGFFHGGPILSPRYRENPRRPFEESLKAPWKFEVGDDFGAFMCSKASARLRY